MFLFKPKTKSSELPPLPPPPPDAIELDSFETYEEQPKYKPKFYDEFIKSKPVQTFPELQEFSSLAKNLDEELKQKKVTSLKKLSSEKKADAKKSVEKPKIKLKDKNFGLESVNFTENPPSMELTFTDASKPKEVAEAQEEIKDAIEKIKAMQKHTFFSRLFAKNKKPPASNLLQGSNIPKVQEIIDKSREALTKMDLESAKSHYLEIIKVYNKMIPEEQAKVYNDIKDLYLERKSAEEIKI